MCKSNNNKGALLQSQFGLVLGGVRGGGGGERLQQVELLPQLLLLRVRDLALRQLLRPLNLPILKQ